MKPFSYTPFAFGIRVPNVVCGRFPKCWKKIFFLLQKNCNFETGRLYYTKNSVTMLALVVTIFFLHFFSYHISLVLCNAHMHITLSFVFPFCARKIFSVHSSLSCEYEGVYVCPYFNALRSFILLQCHDCHLPAFLCSSLR